MALAEPPLSVIKVQALPHFWDSVKAKFQRLTVHMLNGILAFSKVNPVLGSIAIYALCTATGLIMWIAMGFLDLAAGTCVLEVAIHVIKALNEHFLPTLQLLNGVLALFVGFVILVGRIHINVNVNSNRSRHNPNKMSTLSNRSKMIAALPKGKYRCLGRSDDAIAMIHLHYHHVQFVWGVLGRRMKFEFFPTADTIFTFIALIGGFFHVLSITLPAFCAEPL